MHKRVNSQRLLLIRCVFLRLDVSSYKPQSQTLDRPLLTLTYLGSDSSQMQSKALQKKSKQYLHWSSGLSSDQLISLERSQLSIWLLFNKAPRSEHICTVHVAYFQWPMWVPRREIQWFCSLSSKRFQVLLNSIIGNNMIPSLMITRH